MSSKSRFSTADQAEEVRTITDDDVNVPMDLWGALLFEARRNRRMSQPRLARAAGVTQQTISKLEAGRLCPNDRVKLRLAAALDVQPSMLFPWPSLHELTVLRRRSPVDGRSPRPTASLS